MSHDPTIRNARAIAGKLREAWLRADASATTATVDRDDLDAARDALLNLSALLEAVDSAAVTRARGEMAARAIANAHKLPTTNHATADKED